MLPRIHTNRAIGPYEVELTWDDGQTEVVDFAETIAQGGVFAPLADPEFFRQVAVDPSGRFITWPGDIDFCADALRLAGVAVATT